MTVYRFFFAALAFAIRASTAFFALADRSLAVIVSSDRFPPIRPPFAPWSRRYARTLSGISGIVVFFATFINLNPVKFSPPDLLTLNRL
jgi:hypothetical protein